MHAFGYTATNHQLTVVLAPWWVGDHHPTSSQLKWPKADYEKSLGSSTPLKLHMRTYMQWTVTGPSGWSSVHIFTASRTLRRPDGSWGTSFPRGHPMYWIWWTFWTSSLWRSDEEDAIWLILHLQPALTIMLFNFHTLLPGRCLSYRLNFTRKFDDISFEGLGDRGALTAWYLYIQICDN